MEPGGRHLVLLGISGVQDVMTLFRSDENGNVVLNVSMYFHIV
jgi:DNA integrity scanning protein DisA with diadenylate cyclase activity